LAVVEDGRAIPLDRQRLRTLLAYLLLNVNEVISTDRLIDEVWGPTATKTAGASLQNYVSRLRKAIGAELVVSQPAGYVLRVGSGPRSTLRSLRNYSVAAAHRVRWRS
jgi:DNA-binding SARP family transcriptional activator